MNLIHVTIILISLLTGLITYEQLVLDDVKGHTTPLAPNPLNVL